jgi:multiple antibiotic resistance protein
MPELFLDFFIIFLVVIDPVGLAPIFAAMTLGGSARYKRAMAWRGTVIATIILFAFAVSGGGLLRVLGIGVAAFQIAGGLLLFLLAVEMVFARQTGIRSTTERERLESEAKKDISVFPLAVPLIAGPGALTTVLLTVGERGDDPAVIAVVLGVVLLVLLLTLAALLFAAQITKVIGETGANVVSRVLGIVLAALAVQFVLDGLTAGLRA